jgi:hypothetical protein
LGSALDARSNRKYSGSISRSGLYDSSEDFGKNGVLTPEFSGAVTPFHPEGGRRGRGVVFSK